MVFLVYIFSIYGIVWDGFVEGGVYRSGVEWMSFMKSNYSQYSKSGKTI